MRFATAASFVLVLALSSGCGFMRVGSSAREIRSSPRAELHLPRNEGAAHLPQPLAHHLVPNHPFMAQHGASCMHADPYTTNTYSWSGPLGNQPEVDSRSMGFLGGECPTINFDSKGRIVTVCVRDRRPSLVLLDPKTLRLLDRRALPHRRTPLLRLRKMLQDTSGGAYFYLDQHDRAVIGTADGTIDVIGVQETADGPRFSLHERIDVKPFLEREDGSLDKITAVLPDYQGNYWFSTRYGRVGTVTTGARAVHVVKLPGEQLQNAFSVSLDGVYVVSDHALYRFELADDGAPKVVWRELYDRGSRTKVGQINQGSGTTPTLLGDDYIAIADNAEPRMNVLVYRRHGVEGQRAVCKVPVFEPGQSATENTMIGYGSSLVVENNAGYDIFRTMRGGKTSAPGIARIDLRPDGSGCDVVWQSSEISQTTVPKLSTSNGLIYLYTKRPNAPRNGDAFYFTAIDFTTGRTVYRVLTGTGMRFDNNWAAISLARDGSAYVGVLNGFLRVRDKRPEVATAAPLPAGLATLGLPAFD
ncbi:MAG: hypothetical protein JWN04_804 [Myxococcaceae bacterium]|nr:hypothetical protein [Myxococcaceae bacterium]